MFRGIAVDGFERTVLKNRSRVCPCCGAPLRFAYRRKRQILLLRERLALEVDIDRCSDPACPLRAGFAPPEEARLALPKFIYGLDVLTEIARQRWAAAPIAVRDSCRLAHDVRPADFGTVRRLRDADVAGARDRLRPARSTAHRRAQSTRRDHPRHRRAATGERPRDVVLAAGCHLAHESPHAQLDEQQRGAPGGGQFHFFRNLAQPVADADRAMKKRIKKTLRGIAPVERSLAAHADAAGVAQATAYCIALRATLTDPGKPPLDPGGLKMVTRLQQVDQSLATSREKGGSSRWTVCDG